jgi:hypothetical protein
LLITAANLLFVLSSAVPASYDAILGPVSALLMLMASLVFAVQVSLLALRPTGGFPETNILLVQSSVSLVLISLILLLEQEGFVRTAEIFSPQLIFLALVGFAGSMIYTVEIRSVSFRQSDYYKILARLVPKFQALAIGITFLSILLPFWFLSMSGGLLFLGAAVSVTLTIKIFEFVHPLMYRPAMTKMHFTILRYNQVGIVSGSAWLLLGCLLGVILIGTGSDIFLVRDIFIHSIAIGFIGSTITVFAPMLLPALLGRKAPVAGLSFGPILLLNAGILLRVAGDFSTFPSPNSSLPIWESISGPLILGAMIWLLVILPRIGKQQLVRTSLELQSTKKIGLQFNKIRDATLIVIGRKSRREVRIPLWFAEKEGAIYLLPMQGSKTGWYLNLLSNSYIRLEIDEHIFKGKAKVITDRNQVHSAVGLFKDKYGDRVYKNFYKDGVDRAVVVSVEEELP